MTVSNNTITLYHGSQNIVETPLYGAWNRHNDYGQGFYCTEDMDSARERAVQERKGRDGYVNCYSLDMTSLSVLDLDSPGYNILHWLTILLQNRKFDMRVPTADAAKEYLLKNFSFDYQSYDVIRGYRADDGRFSFAKDFLFGAIALQDLCYAVYFGDAGRQTVLKSGKAFSRIKFTGAEPVSAEVWYPKAQERDRKARRVCLKKVRFRKNDICIHDFLREKVTADDPRVQRYLSVGRAK